MAETKKLLHIWNLAAGKVDRKKMMVSGVSMMTEGPVMGWGMIADRTTLNQVMDCAQKYKGGLKVQMDHGAGAWSTVASLKNFRIEGNQLRGDMMFLQSKKMEADYIMEMAEEMPDSFGLSIRFSGDPETVDNLPMARCAEIYSCDIVDRPAANPGGLFSQPIKPVDMPEKPLAANTQENFSMNEADLKALAALIEGAIKPISEKIVALEAKVAAPAPAPAPAPAAPAPANVIQLSQADFDAKIQAAIVAGVAKAGITASGAPAPAPASGTPPPAPAEKTFEVLRDEIAVERKMSLGEATVFCVRNFQAAYQKYLTGKLGVIQK